MHCLSPLARRKIGIGFAAVCALALGLHSRAIAATGTAAAQSYVGMPARLEQVILPGPPLVARPLADRQRPLVLRIEQVYPHGSEFRYDMVYYALEPGEYDLRDYLLHEDGTAADDLPPLPVKVVSSLPPGQIEPGAIPGGVVPRLGGYRLWAGIAIFFWVLGLGLILLVGRRREASTASLIQTPLSLEEQLENAADLVVSGRFTEADRSQLERLLLAYWRERLGLADARPDEAMAALRAHPEAARVLDQLERWLHRPGEVERVDVIELLRPYRGQSNEPVYGATVVGPAAEGPAR